MTQSTQTNPLDGDLAKYQVSKSAKPDCHVTDTVTQVAFCRLFFRAVCAHWGGKSEVVRPVLEVFEGTVFHKQPS